MVKSTKIRRARKVMANADLIVCLVDVRLIQKANKQAAHAAATLRALTRNGQ